MINLCPKRLMGVFISWTIRLTVASSTQNDTPSALTSAALPNGGSSTKAFAFHPVRSATRCQKSTLAWVSVLVHVSTNLFINRLARLQRSSLCKHASSQTTISKNQAIRTAIPSQESTIPLHSSFFSPVHSTSPGLLLPPSIVRFSDTLLSSFSTPSSLFVWHQHMFPVRPCQMSNVSIGGFRGRCLDSTRKVNLRELFWWHAI